MADGKSNGFGGGAEENSERIRDEIDDLNKKRAAARATQKAVQIEATEKLEEKGQPKYWRQKMLFEGMEGADNPTQGSPKNAK